MPESKMMDIFLVTGFLGAGKTTLLKHYAITSLVRNGFKTLKLKQP